MRSRLGVLLFAGAVVVTLVAGHLLRDTPGYVVRQADGSLAGDINHYVYWTRLVTLGGIQAAYSGSWPETYAVYPPLTLYAYEAVGTVYQRTQDPTFDPAQAQSSAWLHQAIKFVALVFHVLTGAAIFWFVQELTRNRTLAGVASALYLVNPATLYDVAHWGQPDGAHSLFSVIAVGCLSLGMLVPAWLAFALAALAKPQAWSLGPLLAIASIRNHGIAASIKAVCLGAALTGMVVAPFIVTGHTRELLSLPGTISSVMPVVSADAHNFWWLVLQPRGIDPIFLFDSERFVGPITYRLAAAALVGIALLATYWLYLTRRVSLAEAAALGVLGWFVFTTQAHENHLFFALPLLSLAWPQRRGLLVPFGVISLTLLLNMVLHDQLVLEALGAGVDDAFVGQLREVNAALNVTCCLVWFFWAALRVAEPRASGTVRRWPRPRPIRARVPT